MTLIAAIKKFISTICTSVVVWDGHSNSEHDPDANKNEARDKAEDETKTFDTKIEEFQDKSNDLDPPPSYQSPSSSSSPPYGVLHYLQPTETVVSLSLLYKVPAHLIRNHNRLFSDHLLQARRTIEIPSPPYTGPSLSHPLTDEEEEQETKKSKIKRFQLKTKCVDFYSAEIYLKNAAWDEEIAARNWLADERWVIDNPIPERSIGRGGKEIAGKGGKWGLRAFGY